MRNEVDVPRLEALNAQWALIPPLCIQLLRLSDRQGVPRIKPSKPQELDPNKMASEMGVPPGALLSQLPDDPALKFFDE